MPVEEIAPATSAGTNISATLVDVNGNTWSTAVVIVTFKAPPNEAPPFVFNGDAFQMQYRLRADASGFFSIPALPDNFSIWPFGSMWHFVIAPNADNSVSVQFDIFVAGPSMDLSPTFLAATAAQLPKLVQSMAVPRAEAESDVIITPNEGQMYFNTTDQQMYFWSSGAWTPFEGAQQGGDAYQAYNDLPKTWGPPTDWWAIQRMVESGRLQWDNRQITGLRYGMLLLDLGFTTDIPGDGNNYYLSDGTDYLNNSTTVTHTWDLSKDKPSTTSGYAERAILVGNSSGNISISNLPMEVIYIYIGTGTVTFLSLTTGGAILRAIICGPNTVADPTLFNSTANTAIYCTSLIRCDLPTGSTYIGTNVFNYCWALQALNLPTDCRYCFNNAFGSGGAGATSSMALYIIRALSNIFAWDANAFPQFIRQISVPVGWQPGVNVSLAAYSMSPGGITKMIQNAAGTTPFTFTLGSANIAMLPQATLVLAASKGITLA